MGGAVACDRMVSSFALALLVGALNKQFIWKQANQANHSTPFYSKHPDPGVGRPNPALLSAASIGEVAGRVVGVWLSGNSSRLDEPNSKKES